MVTVKLFSGSATNELAQAIGQEYGQPLGELKLEKFSDGEMSPAFNESVRGNYVFIIQSTHAPAENMMEMLLIVDAAKRASADYVTVVMPYFGYARQDRKARPRVSIGAKLMANLLMAAGANRIMTCDLHAGQIQGFFDIPVDHLDGSYIFVPHIKALNLPNLIFASPDVGGVARARKYAAHLEVDLVICDKQRKRANQVEAMTVIGDVTDADVVLIDDMVDTAGTICRAAALLKEKGARSVRAVATHPVLSGPAYERIADSELEELIVADTIPLQKQIDKIKVVSVANMFAKAIKNVHSNESISSLFLQ